MWNNLQRGGEERKKKEWQPISVAIKVQKSRPDLRAVQIPGPNRVIYYPLEGGENEEADEVG